MTNNIVDTDTGAFGIGRVLAQTGRNMTMIERVVVDQLINLCGFNSFAHVRSNEVHQLRVEAARGSHVLPVGLSKSDFWPSSDHGGNSCK